MHVSFEIFSTVDVYSGYTPQYYAEYLKKKKVCQHFFHGAHLAQQNTFITPITQNPTTLNARFCVK
jgi:hypothetical protein